MGKFNIRDFLNRIKWHPKENPEDYEIVYVSRGEPNDKAIVNCKYIVKVYHRGFEYKRGSSIVYIPFHRIIEIRKKSGEIIFRSPRHSQ